MVDGSSVMWRRRKVKLSYSSHHLGGICLQGDSGSRRLSRYEEAFEHKDVGKVMKEGEECDRSDRGEHTSQFLLEEVEALARV